MSNLGPQYQNLSYGSLLQVPGGVTSTLQPVTDGNGNSTGLSLSLTSVGISGLIANTASNIAGGAPGAVLYQIASGITGFTPIGSSGQVLASNATGQPYWTSIIQQATLAGSSTAIVGGSSGALPYQSAANVTSFTSIGDAGQVLVSNGSSAPSWSNYAPNAFLSTSAFNLQGGFAGSLVYQSNTNLTSFISPGTSGQYLQASGSAAPTWVTLTPGSIGALPRDGSLSMTGSLSLGGNRIVSIATPVYSDDAATKSYVDNSTLGLNLKSSCVAATTANITLSGAQTIDGVSCVAGNRVLVKNQTAQENNGIYVVSTGAWGRSSDANTWISLVGATVFITGGTTLASTTWSSTISSGGTLGTTPVTFAQFAGSQTYSAGAGLSLVGNTFSLITPVSSATNISSGVAGDLLYQSAAGTTSKLNISSEGFILVSDGTKPVWGLVAPYAARLQYGTSGAIVYQSGSSATSFLPIGTNNYVLTSNGTNPVWALPQSSNTPNSLTFNSSGLGGASPVSFNGSAASTISYNTIGAAATGGSNATGTWPISISGSALNATSAVSITGNSGVAAGTYSNPTITVNYQGLITSATAGSGNIFVDVTQAPYNVVSDNTGAYAASNTTAMQQAINDIKSTTANFLTPHKILYVPSGYYCFNAKLVVDAWINIECHSICVWSWAFNTSNPTNVGILIDYSSNRSYSLSRIRLPAMQGPVGQATGYPGYSSPSWSYNLNLRQGNAIELRGGYWLDVFVTHVSGFDTAVLINGPSPSFACDNINVTANTIDLCVKGFSLVGASNSVTCVANTLFCKYPFYTDSSSSYTMNGVSMKCTGTAFINELNGCAIYAVGTSLRNSSFYIEACKAGYQSDSTTYSGQYVPSNTICAYLGGNQYPSGELGYGNVSQSTGYFGGNLCNIQVGIVSDGDAASTPIPQAGNMIRVRNAGNNNIRILHNDYYAVASDYTYIPVTYTAGEQYFNGGIGSAPHAKVVPLYASGLSIAPGGVQTAYAYHQLINGALPGTKMQGVLITRIYNPISNPYIIIQATITSNNNREILFEFINTGSSTFNGNLNFYITIPN